MKQNSGHVQKKIAFIDGMKCIGCGSCKRNCEAVAISRGREYYIVDGNKCVGCGVCASKCPADAISFPQISNPD